MAERLPLESFLTRDDLDPKETEVEYKFLRGKRGDKGDKGEKGDPAKDGKDGLDGKDGSRGSKGEKGDKGERGERGFVGEKGDTGEIEVENLEALVLSLLPDSSEITPKEVIDKINASRGGRISRSKIEGFDDVENMVRGNSRQLQNFISLGGSRSTAIKASGVLLGTGITTVNFVGASGTKVGDGSEVNITTGGGTGTVNSIVAGTGISVDSTDPSNPIVTNTGSAPSFVENEIVSGSGTTFTLANTPVALSVHVFALGQRLTLGASNDYTISGAVITTANSWSAGAIVADYRK